MKQKNPVSPSHCLQTLNETMQSDILRSLHAKIEPKSSDPDFGSPLDVLIASLQETLALFEDFPELVITENPFCIDPLLPFEASKALKHDLALMRFQLKGLKNIRDDLM